MQGGARPSAEAASWAAAQAREGPTPQMGAYRPHAQDKAGRMTSQVMAALSVRFPRSSKRRKVPSV